jgi:hypothetical protein
MMIQLPIAASGLRFIEVMPPEPVCSGGKALRCSGDDVRAAIPHRSDRNGPN